MFVNLGARWFGLTIQGRAWEEVDDDAVLSRDLLHKYGHV